jgi:hypothetical protein
MTERERIEEQILQVLAKETHAIPLSNKLFSPDGLFSQMASTEEERRIVAQRPLFKQAQRRLTELQRKEALEFARAVHQAQAAIPEGGCLLKLECPDNPLPTNRPSCG